MTALLFLTATLGCAIGATARYGISRALPSATFPWPTMVSNVLGSALLGVVAAAFLQGDAHVGWLLVLGFGVGGGLSTFSTLAVDAVLLGRNGRSRTALIYLIATLTTGLAAAAAGWGIWGAWPS